MSECTSAPQIRRYANSGFLIFPLRRSPLFGRPLSYSLLSLLPPQCTKFCTWRELEECKSLEYRRRERRTAPPYVVLTYSSFAMRDRFRNFRTQCKTTEGTREDMISVTARMEKCDLSVFSRWPLNMLNSVCLSSLRLGRRLLYLPSVHPLKSFSPSL